MGDEAGTVGVGCASAGEVMQAVKKAVTDAKRHLVVVPLTKNNSLPHYWEARAGSAKVWSSMQEQHAMLGGNACLTDV